MTYDIKKLLLFLSQAEHIQELNSGYLAVRYTNKLLQRGKKMYEVRKRLFIGNEFDCRTGNEEWGIVHACKHPCHQRAVGYSGNLNSSHPNYLVLEKRDDLFLNIIDPPRPLFMPQLFISFLEFSSKQWETGKNILIHCNQGESRAPTLAMMFLAKHLDEISNSSYAEARIEFEKLYSGYRPGNGIQIYLNQKWQEF